MEISIPEHEPLKALTDALGLQLCRRIVLIFGVDEVPRVLSDSFIGAEKLDAVINASLQ